ncbi:MAG: hypothetical protein F4X66_00895 [Chloroflexi bacterium]|nr:hypothetical protein [Chloroflexota bacterium]MYE40141.1 hypothetical protein [Chloroflexota bacterium]
MTSLPPWAIGPFELMVHAESHLREADDFGRSIALISFDNAIEVAITTYLTLHPVQRGGRQYKRDDVNQWMQDYLTKLGFFEKELEKRSLTWSIEKSHIIWAHRQRNEQYHGGQKGIPDIITLQIARNAALWIFSVLFEVGDPEAALEQAILDRTPQQPPAQERDFDMAIDAQYGIITVGEQDYYASELLFAVDHPAYRDLGGKLIGTFGEEAMEEVEP